MRHYTILRLLLAGLFIYIAWPLIPLATTKIEKTFWGIWLGFFMLVSGANLATLLTLTRPPIMEQSKIRKRNTH